MTHNPYRAPISTVQDPPFRVPPRPPEVTRACQILWAVLVVSSMTLHPAIRGDWWVIPDASAADDVGTAIMVVVTAFFTIVYGALVWLTGRRHNWARWGLLVFIAATTLLGLSDLPRSFSETPVAAILDACFTVVELWAFRLLFFGPAAEWFRSA